MISNRKQVLVINPRGNGEPRFVDCNKKLVNHGKMLSAQFRELPKCLMPTNASAAAAGLVAKQADIAVGLVQGFVQACGQICSLLLSQALGVDQPRQSHDMIAEGL